MTCTVERRNAVQRAAQTLRDNASTAAVDVETPRDSDRDDWTLVATLNSSTVPPSILRTLAIERLTLCVREVEDGPPTLVATA